MQQIWWRHALSDHTDLEQVTVAEGADGKMVDAGTLQGSARVVRCLQDNREELGMECSATLFDAEVGHHQFSTNGWTADAPQSYSLQAPEPWLWPAI